MWVYLNYMSLFYSREKKTTIETIRPTLNISEIRYLICRNTIQIQLEHRIVYQIIHNNIPLLRWWTGDSPVDPFNHTQKKGTHSGNMLFQIDFNASPNWILLCKYFPYSVMSSVPLAIRISIAFHLTGLPLSAMQEMHGCRLIFLLRSEENYERRAHANWMNTCKRISISIYTT